MADATSEEAVRIYEEMRKLFAGRSTAAVYMAIGLTLGHMESHAKRPDRDGLFHILSEVMDDTASHLHPN